MKTLSRLLPWVVGVIALSPALVFCQNEPSNNSAACCPQDNSPRIVLVNGVAEPVYRGGTKGISIPHAIYQPSAEYSEKARKRKIQGTVMLSAVVTSTGEVTEMHVTKALGYGLDEKAVEAVRRWKFQPAMKDGKPVSVSLVIEQNFHLY